MAQMMCPWSRLPILVSDYSDKKECLQFRLVTMPYLSSECYGGYYWFMVDGTTWGLVRWSCTFSTKTCFSHYLSSLLASSTVFQVKPFLTIFISLSTIWLSPLFHFCSERFLSKMLIMFTRKKNKLRTISLSLLGKVLLMSRAIFLISMESTNTLTGSFPKYTLLVRKIVSLTIKISSCGLLKEPLKQCSSLSFVFISLEKRP